MASNHGKNTTTDDSDRQSTEGKAVNPNQAFSGTCFGQQGNTTVAGGTVNYIELPNTSASPSAISDAGTSRPLPEQGTSKEASTHDQTFSGVNYGHQGNITVTGGTVNILPSNLSASTSASYDVSASRSLPEQDVTSNLKGNLQKSYKDMHLPCASWMREVKRFDIEQSYVDLKMTSKTAVEKSIQLENIFDPCDGKVPKRILVEGQPAIGKTTLAMKLAYDWGVTAKYMEKFDLAFLIQLRNMKGRNVEQVIQSINEGCGVEGKVDLSEEIQRKTLLVLDGFDELGGDSRKDVLKSLYGLKLSSMTIIVTCRSGIFPLATEEIGELRPDLPINNGNFYETKITIEGIERDNREKFLTKFCTEKKTTAVISLLEELPEESATMLKSPLLLLLLSYFVEHKKEVNTKSTVTNLYKSLFNNIVKCNLERKGKLKVKTCSSKNWKSSSKSFDLFDTNDETSIVYQEWLEKFGKLCLQRLKEKNYSFEQDELIFNIYEMGFLIRQRIVGMWEADEHFECFHLSFMEFCAAYSIWRKSQTNQGKESFDDEELSQLMKRQALLGVFVFGLLQKKVFELDISFLRYLSIYNLKFVAELERNQDMAKILSGSITTIEIDRRKFLNYMKLFQSQYFAGIVKNVIEIHKDHRIEIPLKLIGILPSTNQLIADLTLDIDFNDVELGKYLNAHTQIRCSKLRVQFFNLQEKVELESEFEKIVNVLLRNKVAVNELIIDTNGFPATSLDRSFQHGAMKKMVFNELKFWGDFNKGQSNVICKLLEKDRVHKITMRQYTENDLAHFFAAAVESQSLRVLELENQTKLKIAVDVHSIVQKKWRFLKFRGYNLNCSSCVVGEHSLTQLTYFFLPTYQNPCFKVMINEYLKSSPSLINCIADWFQQKPKISPDWLQQKPKISIFITK